MTQGIPAALKQIDDRLDLDLEGSCGKGCKICSKKNYRLDAAVNVMHPNKKVENPLISTVKVDSQGIAFEHGS